LRLRNRLAAYEFARRVVSARAHLGAFRRAFALGKRDPVVSVVGVGPTGLVVGRRLHDARISYVLLEPQDRV